MLMIEVSDIQLELSLAERWMYAVAVYDDMPRLLPTSVMLTDAEPARFEGCARLSEPYGSDEMASETLADMVPAVAPTRMDRLAKCASKHASDVSETHCDRSQELALIRVDTDAKVRPAPIMVMLAEPDDAPFTRWTILTCARPSDTVLETLPALSPIDTDTRAEAAAPFPARHKVAVSDAQVVPSLAVEKARACKDQEPKPICAPYTVTLDDADATLLPAVATDKVGADTDTDSDIEPARSPTDKVTLLLLALSLGRRHVRQLSDTHALASHAVPPTRPALE